MIEAAASGCSDAVRARAALALALALALVTLARTLTLTLTLVEPALPITPYPMRTCADGTMDGFHPDALGIRVRRVTHDCPDPSVEVTLVFRACKAPKKGSGAVPGHRAASLTVESGGAYAGRSETMAREMALTLALTLISTPTPTPTLPLSLALTLPLAVTRARMAL